MAVTICLRIMLPRPPNRHIENSYAAHLGLATNQLGARAVSICPVSRSQGAQTSKFLRATVSLRFSTRARIGFPSKIFRFWRDWGRRKQFIQDPVHELLVVCKARVSVRNLSTHLSPHPPILATLATASVYAFDICKRRHSGVRVHAVAFFKFILIQALYRPVGCLSMADVVSLERNLAGARADATEAGQDAKQKRQRLNVRAQGCQRAVGDPFSLRYWICFQPISPIDCALSLCLSINETLKKRRAFAYAPRSNDKDQRSAPTLLML